MKDGLSVDENKAKFWYKNNELHREDDLPAVVYGNGDKFWYKNGKLHRVGGPAIIYSNGREFWYKEGVQCDPEEITVETKAKYLTDQIVI